LTLTHTNDSAPSDAHLLAPQSHTGSGTESKNDRNSRQSQAIVLQSQPGADRADNDDPGQQVQALLVTDGQATDTVVEAPTKALSPPDRQALSYSRALELISRYAGEVDQLEKQSSDLSRHKFVSSSTRESHYAAYVEAWRRRVETVGNRNYPDIARQQNLSGELILAVAIDRDGLVRSIRVTRSSGIKVLDDAAVQITALAAPFEPLPEAIVQETDVLHISRTWQFMENARLISR
jgi:protein TonB